MIDRAQKQRLSPMRILSVFRGSLQMKVMGVAAVAMVIVAIAGQIMFAFSYSKLVSGFESESKKELTKVFNVQLQSYQQSLIGRVKNWLVGASSALGNPSTVDREKLESMMLGFGNSLASSYGLKRIDVYNLKNEIAANYLADNKIPPFDKAKARLAEVIQRVIKKESVESLFLLSDAEDPTMAILIPSEDSDDEVAWVHVYYMAFEPYLNQFSKTFSYPTYLSFAGSGSSPTKIFPDEFKADLDILSQGGAELAQRDQDWWRKREFHLEGGFFPAGTVATSWASVTQMEGDAHFLKMLFLAVNLGLTLVTCIAFYLFMKRINRPVEGLVLDINGISNSSLEISNTLKASSQSTLEAIERELQAVGTTASAATEITETLSQNLKVLEETRILSQESRRRTDLGIGTIDEVIRSISEVRSAFTSVRGAVEGGQSDLKAVADQVKQIASKTAAINEIVFQTKLLSFNASVEAARAGENGKGFAIVAQEVGKLAKMSGDAALEISKIVEATTQSVEEAVLRIGARTLTATESATANVDSVQKSGERSKESMLLIQDSTSQVELKMKGLEQALNEQFLAIRSITTSIQEVQGTANQTKSESERSDQTSDQLERLSRELSKAVDELQSLILGASGDSLKDSSGDNAESHEFRHAS